MSVAKIVSFENEIKAQGFLTYRNDRFLMDSYCNRTVELFDRMLFIEVIIAEKKKKRASVTFSLYLYDMNSSN